MIRALAKGSVLFAFGYFPGGPGLYRRLTRRAMGTQATHVDKLVRVWPGYVSVWESLGIELEGKRIWVHEGGYTLTPFLLSYILTGQGAVVTNVEGELAEQYVPRAVEAVMGLDFSSHPKRLERQDEIKGLAGTGLSAHGWVEALGGTLYEGVDLGSLPIEDSSVDLVHSGGVLEHLKPRVLNEFLVSMSGKLKPGGLSSHIFDHRDHLYHADKAMLFLNHLRYSESAYRFLFGHALGYHNRLCSQEVREAFEQAGLDEVLVRRLILPDQRYVVRDDEALHGLAGLDRKVLHARFKHSEADLHTAAGHYLFR